MADQFAYSRWLRDIADRFEAGEAPKPCHKALRRAAANIESLLQTATKRQAEIETLRAEVKRLGQLITDYNEALITLRHCERELQTFRRDQPPSTRGRVK